MSGVTDKESNDNAADKPTVTLPGRVEKIVQSVDPREPEKVQIHIDGADPLYQEIRVENTLKDASGEEVALKKGSHVEVTIEAPPDATVPKASPAAKTPPEKK